MCIHKIPLLSTGSRCHFQARGGENSHPKKKILREELLSFMFNSLREPSNGRSIYEDIGLLMSIWIKSYCYLYICAINLYLLL